MVLLKSNYWFLFIIKTSAIFFLISSSSVMGDMFGIPAMNQYGRKYECLGSTDVSTGVGMGDGYCWFRDSTKPAVFDPKNQPAIGYKAHLSKEFTTTYVPYASKYKIREHFCKSRNNEAGWCTLAESLYTQDSVNSVAMNSAATISSQNPDFGGGTQNLSIPDYYTLCLTLVDGSGREWRTTDDPITCSDAGILPETPAVCYLNQNMDLTVEMGSLERSNIATEPASGTLGNIKKSYPVLCTRDAGTTVKTTFQFTPLTVNGNEVVSTSTSNLGVAIFYNGKLVGPTSTAITETFEPGYTNRELEFQAVRNPSAALGDIHTGDFTASAVMVMTEQ